MPNVIVTNKNAEGYTRSFNGVSFTFPPGEPVTIPEAAAQYLFAYGKQQADRNKILVRNGWQRNGLKGDPFGPDAALKRLQSFVFKAAPDDEPRKKPEKKLAPATAEMKAKREMTGINAVSPALQSTGGMVHHTSKTLHLPHKGASAPMLQTAP